MINLNNILKQIKQQIPSQIFSKALDLYSHDKVTIEDIVETESSIRIYSSLLTTQLYSCSIEFFLEDHEITGNMSCTCKAFESYSGPCKHIVASILTVSNDQVGDDNTGEEVIVEPEPLSRFHYVISNLEQHNIKNTLMGENIELTWHINLSANHYLEYSSRVGVATTDNPLKLFTIRNLLKSYNQAKKMIAIDDKNYYLNHTDNKIFEHLFLLSELYKTDGYYYDSIFNNNYIKIPLKSSIFLYELLSKKDKIVVTYKGYDTKSNKNIIMSIGNDLSELEPSIHFTLDEDMIKMKTTEQDIIHFDNIIVSASHNKIYFTNEENPLLLLSNSFLEEEIISFNDFQTFLTKFYSYNVDNQNITFGSELSNLIDYKPLQKEYFASYNHGYLEISDITENESDNNLFNILDVDSISSINNILASFQKISDKYYSNNLAIIYDYFNTYQHELKKYAKVNIINTPLLNIDDIFTPSFSYVKSKNELVLTNNLHNISRDRMKSILNSKPDAFPLVLMLDDSLLKITGRQIVEVIDFYNTLFINYSNYKKGYKLSKASVYTIFNSDNKYMKLARNNRELIELYDTIINFDAKTIEIPESLDSTLRDYQKYGYRYLKTLDTFGFGGILADEMGLGKTIQALTFIQSLETDKPILIVCPKTLIFNWANEIEKFTSNINYQTIEGSKKERLRKISDINKYKINITSYPLLTKDVTDYEDTFFSYVFFDETQIVKNHKAKATMAAKNINASLKFALTGTPIENNVLELWSIFNIINPNYLGEITNFKRVFHSNQSDETNKMLHQNILPFILKRFKKDVLEELPDKIEDTIYLPLSPGQKKEYNKLTESFLTTVQSEIDEHGLEKSYMTVLSLLTRLRQVCCHPSLFMDSYNSNSSKLDTLLEILEELHRENRKVLVFSQFTSMLDIIEKELNKSNISYRYLSGKTKSEDRRRMVDEFQNEDVSVFLISLKAGGTGLNLTAADTVVIFDPWWNPAVENQAIDRAHRIGQKKSVQVIKLITIDTIEDSILKLQKDKQLLSDSIIKDDQGLLSKLSKTEILELFTKKIT